MHLHHVQLAIPTGSEVECRAFYCGVLGWTELPKPEALAKRGGLWLRAGDDELHLGVEAEFRPARKAHPGLLVDGLAELVAKLRAAGCDVVEDHVVGNRIAGRQPVAANK